MKIEKFDDLSEVEKNTLLQILSVFPTAPVLEAIIPPTVLPLLVANFRQKTIRDWYGDKFWIERMGKPEDKRHKVIGVLGDGKAECILECNPMPEEMYQKHVAEMKEAK